MDILHVHSVKFYRFHWNSGLKLYAIGKNNSELSEETNIKEAQRGLEPMSIDAFVNIVARSANWTIIHSYILIKQTHYLKKNIILLHFLPNFWQIFARFSARFSESLLKTWKESSSKDFWTLFLKPRISQSNSLKS